MKARSENFARLSYGNYLESACGQGNALLAIATGILYLLQQKA